MSLTLVINRSLLQHICELYCICHVVPTSFVVNFFLFPCSACRQFIVPYFVPTKRLSVAILSSVASLRESAFNLNRSMLMNDVQALLWDSINTEMRELFIFINEEEARNVFRLKNKCFVKEKLA